MLYGDNGKENGNYNKGLYGGYIGYILGFFKWLSGRANCKKLPEPELLLGLLQIAQRTSRSRWVHVLEANLQQLGRHKAALRKCQTPANVCNCSLRNKSSRPSWCLASGWQLLSDQSGANGSEKCSLSLIARCCIVSLEHCRVRASRILYNVRRELALFHYCRAGFQTACQLSNFRPNPKFNPKPSSHDEALAHMLGLAS